MTMVQRTDGNGDNGSVHDGTTDNGTAGTAVAAGAAENVYKNFA